MPEPTNLLYSPDRMRLPVLAGLLCLVEGAALLYRPPPPQLVAAPPPVRLEREAGELELRDMTADDLARGLWALQRAGTTLHPDQVTLVREAADLRRDWERLREDRRRAEAAWLATEPRCP